MYLIIDGEVIVDNEEPLTACYRMYGEAVLQKLFDRFVERGLGARVNNICYRPEKTVVLLPGTCYLQV